MAVSKQSDLSSSSSRKTGRSRGGKRGGGLFLIVAFAVVVALSAGACYYLVTSKHGNAFFGDSASGGAGFPSLAEDDGPKKAKPSAYSKQDLAPAPEMPVQHAPASAVTPGIRPVQAPSLAAPATPAQAPPLPSAGPWPAAGMSFTANHKGVRNGCKGGTLTVDAAQLVFRCPTDVAKDVSVARAEVKGADDDGIETLSGKKYHFDIEGKSKDTTHRLFVEWMSQP